MLHLTSSAQERIYYLMSKNYGEDLCREKKVFFRVSVNGGGCSGFIYDYSFTKEKNENDLLIQEGRIQILIDKMSSKFLKDSTLDFVEELGYSYFQTSNPNAATRCGCGNSFSV